MIRILVDSSSDYPVEEIRQKNLELVPISITIGEHNYIEGKNLDRDTFYEILTDGREIPKGWMSITPISFLNSPRFWKMNMKNFSAHLQASGSVSTCRGRWVYLSRWGNWIIMT